MERRHWRRPAVPQAQPCAPWVPLTPRCLRTAHSERRHRVGVGSDDGMNVDGAAHATSAIRRHRSPGAGFWIDDTAMNTPSAPAMAIK